MTMLWFDSFDTGIINPRYISTPTLDTGTKRTGVASARTAANGEFNYDIPASADVTVGVAIYMASTSNPACWIKMSSDQGASPHLGFGMNSTTKMPEIRRGVTQSMTGGALLGTSAIGSPMDASRWYYLEARGVIHDSTGIAQFWVDDVLRVDLSGVDTRSGGTSTDIDRIGHVGNNSGNTYFDDLYCLNNQGSVNNARLADVDVQCIKPDGNGASSQLTGSDSNSTDNYLLVDETTPSMSDYVAGTTSGLRDLYTMGALAGSPSSVRALKGGFYGQKAATGIAGVKVVTKSGGSTKTDDFPHPASLSAVAFNGVIQETDPGGSAWTVSSVNAVEVGVETV